MNVLIMMPDLAALGHFFERLRDHQRIEAEGVLVDAAVFERQRRWLAVGDHDDLAHVLLLLRENALRQAQAFARVGVVRADLHARQLAERHFLGAVVEKHQVQRIARILRADQVRERQGHALGRREAVFAIEDHAVAAIQHQHRGAGALVFALMDHQVGIIERDGHLRAFAAHGVEKRGADVQVQRVAEFVGPRNAAGFDAGGQFARVVTAKAALAERAEQILQRAEAEKIDGLVGNFKARLVLRVAPRAHAARAASCPAAA